MLCGCMGRSGVALAMRHSQTQCYTHLRPQWFRKGRWVPRLYMLFISGARQLGSLPYLTLIQIHVRCNLQGLYHKQTQTTAFTRLADGRKWKQFSWDGINLIVMCVNRTGRQPLPPRAHSHNGLSSSEPPGMSSLPPLPLSRGLTSVMRHDPPPSSLLERFCPPTTLGVAGDRFSELAVNGLPPPATAVSMEPVPMTARRPVTSRNHLPGPAAKTHRAIKCYHCRMCEQVRT